MRFHELTMLEQRLELVTAPERLGITVVETCRLYGVSRDTFYVWYGRYVTEGPAGLENRSTAPGWSPNRIPHELEARIVGMRVENPRWGPKRIYAELVRAGIKPPARSTIGRVLVRNGLIGKTSEPPPAQPLIRFERERANELWQIDAKKSALAEGSEVWIVAGIDDRSRKCLHLKAFPLLTHEAGIEVFDTAAAKNGLPEATLTDRGGYFTGITFDTVVAFERHLWGLGVYTINGRGYHPQTQGKVERLFRTVNEWLQDHGPFETLEDLNRSLAVFVDHYNNDRPHQGIDDQTPAERWEASPKAGPDPALAEQRCRRETTRPTTSTGNISYANWQIGLGRRWARQKVTIIDLGHIIEIWSPDGEHIRNVTPDNTRRYLGQSQ